MKTFKCTIQSVLDLKIKFEENEKNELLRLRAVLNTMYDELNALKKHYENNLIEFREKASKGISPQKLTDMSLYIKEVDQLITTKKNEIVKMQEEVEKQTGVLVELNREIKMLEKLREKQLVLYNQLVQKEDEVLIEDYLAAKV